MSEHNLLPEWNDLPDECRSALRKAAGWFVRDGEDGQCALDMYNELRKAMPPQSFPLFRDPAPAARTSPLLKREQMARAPFEVGAPPHQFWADVGLDKRELYLCMADTALQHAAPSRETISIAISAIKASQAEDYYNNYEKAQQELEALL